VRVLLECMLDVLEMLVFYICEGNNALASFYYVVNSDAGDGMEWDVPAKESEKRAREERERLGSI